MKIVTFINDNNRAPRVGALLNGDSEILDFARAIQNEDTNLLAWFDVDGEYLKQATAVYNDIVESHARGEGFLVARSDVQLIAPVPRPGKLICIGLNYRDHAAESNMPIPERPVVFSKFTSSVIAPNASVVFLRQAGRLITKPNSQLSSDVMQKKFHAVRHSIMFLATPSSTMSAHAIFSLQTDSGNAENPVILSRQWAKRL
jgi:hypothetical protein